jgi:hypothetical protein
MKLCFIYPRACDVQTKAMERDRGQTCGRRARPADGAEAAESQQSGGLVDPRGLEILRSFTAEDTTLGNQELIERTGLPKATVSRLTATLVSLGYLHYDTQLGRYSIGPATVSLGYSALSSSAVVHMAQPLMQSLADKHRGRNRAWHARRP